MKKKKEIEDDFMVFGTAHIAMLERLGDSELRELVINTLKYAKDKTVRHFDNNIAEFVFNSFKVEIDNEIARLKSISEKRRISGRNGGLAKGSKCYQMLSVAKKHEEKEEETKHSESSPLYKNIIKEEIINIEEDIQEDNINPIQDNNINSLNKDGRNINISPIEKRGSCKNPSVEKKTSKESSSLDPDPAMNEVIELWMAYKKERRESYKPIGQRGFVKKLKNLSGDNAETARRIIEQSIANNWAGIFPLKDYSQPCNTARKSMEVGVIMQKEDMDYSSNFTDGW